MTDIMSITAARYPANTLIPPVTITVITLSDEQRINFWPHYFGNVRQWVFIEPQVFSWLDLWSADYRGGVWKFHTLSNGGAFLTPPENDNYHLFNEGNGNEATLTTEATGIAVCLMAWSHHACRTHCEAMSEHYYRLRDYALIHPECSAIMRLID
ncbi:antirestriction protein [Escherichia coli]|nr:antirestriction protein [Escherichia coli]EFB4475688.1 antirestriction protein [Escherichia coli]